jgi:hypothetical protein
MDIDADLREAGQRWRESLGPAQQAPAPAGSAELTPRIWWRRWLTPVAAAVAAAGVVFGVLSLHGMTTSRDNDPAASTDRPARVRPGPPVARVAPISPVAPVARVADSGRIGPLGPGWVARADRIGVTRDGGRSVTLLATLPVPRDQVADVAVLPGLRGAVEVASVGLRGPAIFRSTDGGSRWSQLKVPALSGQSGSAQFVEDPSGVVELQVIDTTSSSFSAGEWFTPLSDGTWGVHVEPAGGAVTRAGSALWLAGGNQNQSLYRSADNGATWTPVAAP